MPPSALSSRRWKSTSCEEERRSLKASWMSAVGAGLNWGSSGWAHCAMSDFDRQSLMLPGSSWDSSGALDWQLYPLLQCLLRCLACAAAICCCDTSSTVRPIAYNKEQQAHHQQTAEGRLAVQG